VRSRKASLTTEDTKVCPAREPRHTPKNRSDICSARIYVATSTYRVTRDRVPPAVVEVVRHDAIADVDSVAVGARGAENCHALVIQNLTGEWHYGGNGVGLRIQNAEDLHLHQGGWS
jgi:hypothetical protein